MSSNEYINAHDAFIFELDDVIYPEKDYLLQVYYLFAQFMEYTEQTDGSQMIRFMQETYAREGETGLFAKTAVHFNLPEKYQSNYVLLHQNARLPLKLLLFAPVLAFMQEVFAAGKRLFLLTDGDPDMQLNKIKQLEWNGIEKHMAVYFTEEIAKGSTPQAVEVIVNFNSLNPDKVIFISKHGQDAAKAFSKGINFLPIDKLLLL